MRRISAYLVLLLLCLATFPSCDSSRVPSEAAQIPEGAVVVDVRTRSEFESGHLEGALHIPYDEMEKHLSRLPRDRTVALYCASGRRSGLAEKTLRDQGYTEVINAGAFSRLKSP